MSRTLIAEPRTIRAESAAACCTPVAAPEVAPIITYDWRSPVIFDLP